MRGWTLSRPRSATVYGKYDMPSMRLYERITLDLIPACRKHIVAATRLSPFKVGDNQRPERTMTGVRKPPPESSVPGDNLPGEVGGINCGGDMGVRRCLARSLTSLALLRTPKSANGPRSQFIPSGFPLHVQPPTGMEDSAIPLTTPDMVRSGRVFQTSVKSHYTLISAFTPNSA